jgi:hypothetical protein
MTQETKCGCRIIRIGGWNQHEPLQIEKCEPCRTALERAERAEALVAQLQDALEELDNKEAQHFLNCAVFEFERGNKCDCGVTAFQAKVAAALAALEGKGPR